MRHLLNTCVGSDLAIFHLESQRNVVEPVLLETLAGFVRGLTPNLASGWCDKRRNRRFRSFFGTNIGTCVDLWLLCCDDFDNVTMPAYLLRTLVRLKRYCTEEESAIPAGAHKDTFRDCLWRALTAVSNT